MTPARRLAGLALVPRWLVSLGERGEMAGYRLRLRWNGGHVLRPASVPAGEACVLVVDSALPFRRKLQRFPATPKARLAMLGSAPEQFPLPAEELLYGMGMRGADAYLYALPTSAREQLAERRLRPAVILVAEARPDAAGCLAAFESYLRRGAALDLLRERRYVSRRALLRLQLGAALGLAVLAVAALLALPQLSEGVLEWRAAALREQGGALPKMYRVTEHMARAQAEAAKLYASPEARLPGILAALFNSVPPGRSLRSIELAEGTLRITGTGGGVQSWLAANGFPPERILEQQTGNLQQFSAERPL